MIKSKIKTLPKLRNGQPYKISHNGGHTVEFVHKCCDCGLEHDLRITRGTKHFIVRFWRLRRKKK